MSDKTPPNDMPQFDGLGHERTRALRVWFFLRVHHGNWYSIREISDNTGLAESTVENALSRIFGLPPLMRPFLERIISETDAGRTTVFRCKRIIEIRTED